MPTFEDLDIEPDDDYEDKLEAFDAYSRQVLYMAFLDNEDLGINLLEEAEDEGTLDIDDDEEGSGAYSRLINEDDAGDESDEDEEDIPFEQLRPFGRYFLEQMDEELPPPDELTVEEWTMLAEEMVTRPDKEKNLIRLADKVYALLKEELRVERERSVRAKSW